MGKKHLGEVLAYGETIARWYPSRGVARLKRHTAELQTAKDPT